MYHTHIDCCHGLSAESMYKACRNLGYEMRSSTAEVEEATMMNYLLDLDLLLRNDDGQCAMHNADRWIDILQQERERLLSDCSQDDNINDRVGLPLRVIDATIEAILHAKLSEVASKLYPTSETKIELEILGTLWWFHRLRLDTSVSITPLRCPVSTVARFPLLFKDVPVHVVDFDDPESTDRITSDGLAILKVLLRAGHGCHLQDDKQSVVPMTIRHVVAGQDYPTIMVGEAFNQAHAHKALALDGHDSLRQPELWDVDHNLSHLETNVDDCTAEHLAFAVELLMQHDGVADCWVTPIVMKKGRSAHTLHCLCRNEHRISVLRVLFRHVPTLGVRVYSHKDGFQRVTLRRSTLSVPLRLHNQDSGANELPEYFVDCKVAYLGEDVVSIKAEFDDCRRLVLETGGHHTLKSVSTLAVQAAQKELDRQLGLREVSQSSKLNCD